MERRALTLAAAALAGVLEVASGAGAGTVPPVATPSDGPRLSEERVVGAFLEHPKVARWLERYPPGPTTDASFDRDDRAWTVHVWSGKAGEIARGVVIDDGRVTEAWTGPQVAWQMARGRSSSRPVQRLHPAKRQNTAGRPACAPSP